MEEIGHWINGKLVSGTSGRFAQSSTRSLNARMLWSRSSKGMGDCTRAV